MSSKKYKYDVTVIIPVFNTEKYIDECVNSIIKQNYDFDKIEVILIDDGSTDNSLMVCEKYQNLYSNIKLISQQNSGVSVARNKGIKNANGKYLMFLDSDDFLSKNAIKNLLSFFEKHYDEVDLVTYNLVWYLQNKDQDEEKIHVRYKAYDKGTDIYDLKEYFYLNQSTINVVIKNNGKDNILFDTNMFLSEDQNFNTNVLMKKEKIGFVNEAKYFYRRTGQTVAATLNNPFYCFEEILKHNEKLMNKFKKDGKVPKYIQSLVINTINWRLNKDELFPYSYDSDKFKEGKERIYNLIKQVDVDVICAIKTTVHNKLFYLDVAGHKYVADIIDDFFVIKCEGNILYSEKSATIEILRFKIKGNKLYIFANLQTPFLNCDDVDLYINKGYKDKTTKKEKLELLKSNKPYIPSDYGKAKTYNVDFEIEIDKLNNFKFTLEFDGYKIPVRRKKNKFVPEYVISKNYIVYYGKKKANYKFIIDKNKFSLRNKLKLQRDKIVYKYGKKDCLKRIIYRLFLKKNVWIYNDSYGNIDNAYYQFKHDIKKNDGIKRFYITNKNSLDLNKYFTDEEQKHLVERNSFKHKILFLSADKLFTSFVDLQVYCPFNEKISRFDDIKHYDLIYLQHGILHASLTNMYSKEFKEIDKFIISSDFEKNNLIKNYNYKEEDLICSTMPRYDKNISKQNNTDKSNKRKILLAPSWRKYLIGPLKNNKRSIMETKFLESNFYNNIEKFLKSKELGKILKDNNIEIHVKMHPNFKDYNQYFCGSDNIKIIEDKINLETYDLFITDFSSFQFDYAKSKTPIIYYVPDYDEFISGLHTYRKLDLSYEDGFGNLCKNSSELIKELKKIIKSDFKVEQKYYDRMNNFFYEIDNPSEYIYNTIIKEK